MFKTWYVVMECGMLNVAMIYIDHNIAMETDAEWCITWVSCIAESRHVVSYRIMPCRAMLCNAMPCHLGGITCLTLLV